MDELSQNFSALMAERRNKIILAAIVVGICIIAIVSMMSSSSSKFEPFTPHGKDVPYRRCEDTGAVVVTSFKIEGCQKGLSGHCLAQHGEHMALTIGFHSKQYLDNLGLFQEMKKRGRWIFLGTEAPCELGLKCPVEVGTNHAFSSSLIAWDANDGKLADYRLKLGQWKNDPGYMCLEFTLEIE